MNRLKVGKAHILIRSILTVTIGSLGMLSGTASAATTTPPNAWVATANPYAVVIGDSIEQQCSNTPSGGLNSGAEGRNSAWMGWAGATTSDWKARMLGQPTSWNAGPTYPVAGGGVLTEDLHGYTEYGWLKDSGSAIIALGTNDASRGNLTDFSANVDWFIAQTGGRPVEWMNLHNGSNPASVAPFNDLLYQKAKQYPQLKVIDWDTFIAHHPTLQNPDGTYTTTLYPDGVHPATWTACEAHNKLYSLGLPYSNSGPAGLGYWYGYSGRTVNGWGVDSSVPAHAANIRVVIDDSSRRTYNYSVNTPSVRDDYAAAANGRDFSITLNAINGNSHKVCIYVMDQYARSQSLGCQYMPL